MVLRQMHLSANWHKIEACNLMTRQVPGLHQLDDLRSPWYLGQEDWPPQPTQGPQVGLSQLPEQREFRIFLHELYIYTVSVHQEVGIEVTQCNSQTMINQRNISTNIIYDRIKFF